MFSGKSSPLIYLFLVILPLLMMGQAVEEPNSNYHQSMVKNNKNSLSYMYERDPALDLLGNSFVKIKKAMGEPDEQGYSNWNGPHNYMLYNHKDGTIIFCSPEDMDTKTAVSIILGDGQEILGAEIGMTFEEIKDILGIPDSGPKPGMDNLYYMDYYFGEKIDGVPEIFISFSADTIDGETRDVFIKWEAFAYEQKKMFEAAR